MFENGGKYSAMPEVQQGATPAPAAMLLNIKGVGPEFAAILWSEGLFRHFDNRRQVASHAGLAPTPWQSGSVDREQGVSKAGNPRLRTTLIQLAWLHTMEGCERGARRKAGFNLVRSSLRHSRRSGKSVSKRCFRKRVCLASFSISATCPKTVR